jgi:drug/metabolite transporter (DMT)-like permease
LPASAWPDCASAALRQGAWRIALVGASLGAAQTLCYFQSLRWLDTGIAVLLFYTFPVVTLAVERYFFKPQVALSALLCVIVIFVGGALTGTLKSAGDELGALCVGEDPVRVEAVTAKLRAAAGSAGPGGIFNLAHLALDMAPWTSAAKR